MNLPDKIRQVCRMGPVFLVGGFVRDTILNRASNDYDFVVAGDAEAFAQRVAGQLGTRVIRMGKGRKVDYRIVSGRDTLDFAPLAGDCIEEDLRRRDFTINALAYDLGSDRLIDPAGGLEDLRSGTVRLVSEEAVRADPVRMLRAVLGFDVAPETLHILGRENERIVRSAGERIRSELFQLMSAPCSAVHVRKLADVGLLSRVIPELGACQGCLQGEIHGRDVFEHTLAVYEQIEAVVNDHAALWPRFSGHTGDYLRADHRNVLLKFAALLHDTGKPACRQTDLQGNVRFLGHDQESGRLAGDIGTRLRMSARERRYVTLIVSKHMRPLFLFNARQSGRLKSKGIVRFGRKYGDDIIGLLIHGLADQRGKAGVGEGVVEEFVRFVDEVLSVYFSTLKPKMAMPKVLTGKDLIDHFGLEPSKLIGKLLNKLGEAHLQGRIETKEEALAMAGRLIEMEGDAGIEPATPSSGGLCSIP
jgi:poly(A) polymerase